MAPRRAEGDRREKVVVGSAVMAALSAGAIQQMYNGDTSSKPTLQLIDVKRIPASAPQGSDRYRLIISDGVFFMQAMLATQLNGLVEAGQVSVYRTRVRSSVISPRRPSRGPTLSPRATPSAARDRHE